MLALDSDLRLEGCLRLNCAFEANRSRRDGPLAPHQKMLIR
jgi:hypothetical protein